MSHIGSEQWDAYVADEVGEMTRRVYEKHLYECDECLARYLQAVELNADRLPKLSDQFADSVMAKISEQPTLKQSEAKRQAKLKKSFFHYVIAAVMTLMLMSTGIFNQLAQVADSIQETPSLTEKLLDHAFSFTQVLERKKEAK